ASRRGRAAPPGPSRGSIYAQVKLVYSGAKQTMSFALRSPGSRLSVLMLVVLAAGCKDRLYDFGGTLQPIDASGAVDSADEAFEALPLPDAKLDVAGVGGGGTGGAAGGGGAGGAAGGSVVACDNASPDRQTDPFNCGTCLTNCTAPNSVPDCVAGVCKI